MIIIFASAYVINNPKGNYLCGLAVDIIYLTVPFYLLEILYYCIKYKKQIEDNVVNGIFRATIIAIIGSTTAAAWPTLYISSQIQILVILTLLLSFENKAEFIDKEKGVLNQYAFKKVLSDRLSYNKSFNVVVAYAEDSDEKKNINTLRNFDEIMQKDFDSDVYILFSGCFASIFDNSKAEEYFMSRIKKYISEDNIYLYKIHDNNMSADKLLKEIEKIDIEAREKNMYIDASTGVRNKNAYEKKIEFLNSSKDNLKGLWGIIIDINNLKIINDTYGHAKGDWLIQTTAKILCEASGDKAKVYRIGGDEFAMFMDKYEKTEAEKFIRLIRKIQADYNTNDDVSIEFAIGYSEFNIKDYRNVQEMMKKADYYMYLNKEKWHEIKDISPINL